jgi:allantoinase
VTDHGAFPDSYPEHSGAGHDWVIRSTRVLTDDGCGPAAVHVSGTLITAVTGWDDVPEDAAIVEGHDCVVMPGIIDTHVHCNEPGRTDWEGFETATAAAAAGGITTILDMPLNSVPATTSRYGLEEKRRASEGKCHVHVGFIGGVVPGNVDELADMADGGVRAFKCFLVDSGVPEFPAMAEADLRKAFPILSDLGLPLMVHAEHPKLLRGGPHGHTTGYAAYLSSRPPEAEAAAIEWIAKMMVDYPVPIHIVHLSSSSSLAIVRNARDRGLPISVETCPHYLTFAAEEIPDGATEYKCAPPIRLSEEREALWEGLLAGDIDMIASDHSPCPPEMKDPSGDFFNAWGGIASLQLSLPAVWTGAQARGLGVEWVSRWMSEATAILAGYDSHKGRITPGFDADIVVWDPDSSFVVDPEHLFHRHKVTPYASRELLGVVHQTYVCGRLAYDSAG